MAETLTVNTDPSTETAAENLTPEEQDSLKLGEEIQSQQETLLAGKYKSAEELEKAYGNSKENLERKIIKIAKQITRLRFQKPKKYQRKRLKLQKLLKKTST